MVGAMGSAIQLALRRCELWPNCAGVHKRWLCVGEACGERPAPTSKVCKTMIEG